MKGVFSNTRNPHFIIELGYDDIRGADVTESRNVAGTVTV